MAIPHAVMVVANDVSTDTRVRKMAHDLAAGGLRVTVLGLSESGRREVLTLGAATVVRIPVGSQIRTSRGQGKGYGRRHRISNEIALRRANYFSRQRTVKAEIGWLRADYFEARARRNEEANRRARKRLADEHARAERRSARMAVLGARQTTFWVLVTRILRLHDRLFAGASRRIRARRETRLENAFHRRERTLRSRLSRRYKRFERKSGKLRTDLLRVIETGDRPDWRRALPELHDYEFALGPELDSIQPNVIHAQDVHLLGVAARAASRALFPGRDVKLIYDAHEYIQGLAHPRPALAWSDLEAEYIDRADAVITVAPAIAERLQRDYRLAAKPTVVMNIPVAGDRAPHPLREVVGVPEDETLAVYSGGLDATRGVHTLVEALRFLPDLHLALVSKAETSYTQELARLARQGGFGEQLHFSPFVEPQQVVDYLSSADVGVHTIVSGPINHELTLPNKIFEYMHARLPIVISDCRAMSELVEELGIGMRFRSEDIHSLVETLSYVIEHRASYRKAYEERPDILDTYSWSSERRKLFALYRSLLGPNALPADLKDEALASSSDWAFRPTATLPSAESRPGEWT